MLANTATSPGKRWRQATVWLHVLTSVGWMAQALALGNLCSPALSTRENAVTAITMARHLDTTLLAPMANASAFTGFVLAAGTAWGYFRHWWVLIKFAITLIQLYLGIFVLSAGLDTAISSAHTGNTTGWALPVGAALMAGAIGVQAWFSIAKPLGRTQWSLRAGRSKPATAPACSVLALVVVLTPAGQTACPQPRRVRSVDVASGTTRAGSFSGGAVSITGGRQAGRDGNVNRVFGFVSGLRFPGCGFAGKSFE